MHLFGKLRLYLTAALRHPANRKKRMEYVVWRKSESSLGFLQHDPLISIIIVSYNSVRDLGDCLMSVVSQSYSKTEIIVVENGEADTEALVRSIAPTVDYVRTGRNVGFAAANNIGRERARGEYVLLVNPDAKLEADCLFELLFPFRIDANIAISAPKLRFWTRFVDVVLSSPAPFDVDLDHLLAQLSYKKLFIPFGVSTPAPRRATALPESDVNASSEYRLVVRLPIDGSSLTIEVSATEPVFVRAQGRTSTVVGCSEGRAKIVTSLAHEDNPSAFWVINNAGSGVGPAGPYDRGFGDKDELKYDDEADVAAFCGCVALVRLAAIIQRPLFRSAFFAYFEDSELSHAIRGAGWKIRYAPRALAYHRHSATSAEGSELWCTLVSRSKALYDFYTGVPGGERALRALWMDDQRYSRIPPSVARILSDYDATVLASSSRRRTIGLYNSYWNTLGGGEAHALALLSQLVCEEDDVYLISETDFSIEKLEAYFSLKLDSCRKIVVTKMTVEFTENFDVFINSTFGSNLPSRAVSSFFIVSFPHRAFDRSIISSYFFLYNSGFTKSWAEAYWRGAKGAVVFPTLALQHGQVSDAEGKEKIVLSIGRFTQRGHAKNQHIILKAFLDAQASHGDADWHLYLVGGVDRSSVEDIAYLDMLMDLSRPNGCVHVLPNCARHELEDLLRRASIYVHAAGVNQDRRKPENHEHFGIAVIEAALFGLLPIVYGVGGPAELVQELGHGKIYADEAALKRQLEEAMMAFPDWSPEAIQAAAKRFCRKNSEQFRSVFGARENDGWPAVVAPPE